MRKLFYKIWVDALITIQRNPKHKSDWKFYSMLFISSFLCLNFLTIFLWFQFFCRKVELFELDLPNLDIFPGKMLDGIFLVFICFYLPGLFLNYYFIFYKRKYEELLKEYSDKKGKVFLSYGGVSLLLLILSLFLFWLLY